MHLQVIPIAIISCTSLLIAANAAPVDSGFFSAASSSSFSSQPAIDTNPTSFSSSGPYLHNQSGGNAQHTESPPVIHQHHDTDSGQPEPGLGPPEDGDASDAPSTGTASGPKRKSSTNSTDLRAIVEYNKQNPNQILPHAPLENIDPQLIHLDGGGGGGYPYEPKDGEPYTTGDKTGIALETMNVPPAVFEPPANRAMKRQRARRMEKEEDYYMCGMLKDDGTLCPISHPTMAALNHHMKNHGPKMYFCEVQNCPSKGFAVRDQLAKHERTVHVSPEDKKYRCEPCNIRTNRHDVWVKHQKTKKHLKNFPPNSESAEIHLPVVIDQAF